MVKINYHANGYRLPTEAEWEFAARGGRLSKGFCYAGSNSVEEVAWWDASQYKEPHRVMQKKPNELGLYDMSGNVWEWCNDWYQADYFSHSPKENPTGPSTASYRVLRGGSWSFLGAEACRISYRLSKHPAGKSPQYGFRVSRSAK